MMESTFFATGQDFRSWLKINHKIEKELWVGYYKKATKIKSITWSESVDEALCFGWIDGLRKRIDEKTYQIRFTPRKPNSHWSAVNISKIKELTENGKMTPAGMQAFHKMKENNSNRASYNQQNIKLQSTYEKQFKSNSKAWSYFLSKSPSYKKQCIWWVISGKQKATQERRLKILIDSSQEGNLIPPLRWTQKKKK